MFGVVPKPLWEKRAPADERNRIRLAMRPLLVRPASRLMIIDAGIGDKMDAKSVGHLRHRPQPQPRRTSLAAAGVSADDIEIVARVAPALRPRRRLHDARRDRRDRARASRTPATSSRAASGRTRRIRTSGTAPAISQENFVPLQDGRRRSTSSTATREIMPGVRVRRTGGHTRITRSSTSSPADRRRSSPPT